MRGRDPRVAGHDSFTLPVMPRLSCVGTLRVTRGIQLTEPFVKVSPIRVDRMERPLARAGGDVDPVPRHRGTVASLDAPDEPGHDDRSEQVLTGHHVPSSMATGPERTAAP